MKSDNTEQPENGYRLPEATIVAVQDLSTLLTSIHIRLMAEGLHTEDDKIDPTPNGTDNTATT